MEHRKLNTENYRSGLRKKYYFVSKAKTQSDRKSKKISCDSDMLSLHQKNEKILLYETDQRQQLDTLYAQQMLLDSLQCVRGHKSAHNIFLKGRHTSAPRPLGGPPVLHAPRPQS